MTRFGWWWRQTSNSVTSGPDQSCCFLLLLFSRSLLHWESSLRDECGCFLQFLLGRKIGSNKNNYKKTLVGAKGIDPDNSVTFQKRRPSSAWSRPGARHWERWRPLSWPVAAGCGHETDYFIRTGPNRRKTKLAPSPTCNCGQTAEHVLQKMPACADSTTKRVPNSIPAAHQTLQQQGHRRGGSSRAEPSLAESSLAEPSARPALVVV